MMTLEQQYVFKSLAVQKTKHKQFEQKLPKPTEVMVAPTTLLGIEIEVENIKNEVYTEYYWSGKQDGSLRNFGCEFVSIPLRAYQLPYALEYLNTALTDNNTPDFSPRTSVHVHLNVRDMSWETIKVFTLLYAIFEKHFFMLAGTKRETSIFCVPLYASTQTTTLPHLGTMQQTSWHKYNAINLGTILGNKDVPKFGTIEFRHLYGTMDKYTIINWVNNILCLRKAAYNYTYDELVQKLTVLNTTSEYLAMYESIFGEYALTMRMSKTDFEYCITQLKHNLLGRYGYNKYPASGNSALYKPTAPELKYSKMTFKQTLGAL